MGSIHRMNVPAKYLVLADAPLRALLFDGEQRMLGEVIEDDAFIVGHMLSTATACPLPRPDMLDSVTPPPASRFAVQCFALSEG